jgi:hypothetical protein
VFMGPTAASMSPSQQVTIGIHELSHVANPDNEVDTQTEFNTISLKCLTGRVTTGHGG